MKVRNDGSETEASPAQRIRSKLSRPALELILIGALAVAVFVFAAEVDAYERIFRFAQRYEEYEIDEALTVGFVLPIAFAIYAWRRWADYRRALQRTERKSAELQASLERQQVLLREVHHRTKNSLAIAASLIRLSGQASDQRADLEAIAARISALASVHEYLQDSDAANAVDLHAHLGRVVGGALSGVPSVAIENEVAETPVPTKTAVNLGLALNEIAANAAKHGFNEDEPPVFRVQSTVEDGTLVLTASNTGNPLPEDVTLENPSSLGLKLVTSLVKQLGGTVTLHRTPQATVEIHVPHEPETPRTSR